MVIKSGLTPIAGHAFSMLLIGAVCLLTPAGHLAADDAAAEKPNAAKPAENAKPEDIEFFEKRVRPLLVANCLSCHGADKQKGGLRLDSREAVLKGGDSGAAVEPGQPDSSPLVEAIGYAGDYKMPPKGKLADEQIATLTEWVKRGAPWPAETATTAAAKKEDFNLQARRAKQWAFQPLKVAPPPAGGKADGTSSSAIDRFIIAKLAAEGLTPAKPADKRTLLRRVTYDLIGLPPTPAEIDAFLAADGPLAFEKVIDRLLASPHYGERWARHWLDLARYAETHGHEFDFEMPLAFEYRDYVIRAFNADLPYNQFVVEQIAGDLLAQPRRNPAEGFNESIIGTGFFFLGEAKHSPVDIRGDEAERVDNQIDVFSKAFLGMTLACARCHDHKFDAISTNDYYALAGILQSSRYQVACIDNPQPRQAIVKQLADLQRQQYVTLGTLAVALEEFTEFPRYLLAAQSVSGSAGSAVPAGPANAPLPDDSDIVFEDFEKPTYEGWTATGNAFGEVPNRGPLPDYQGDVGALGKGFVNSHSALDKSGKRTSSDALTGTLTSQAFKIDRPYIHFLIGGGAHAGKTCINLLVAGKLARTATGRNENRMAWATFDVAEFAGKEARLEIVDAETGGWGNIGVDQIVFSRKALAGAAADRAVPTDAVVAAAKKLQLDAVDLENWIRYLRDTAAKSDDDLFHFWGTLATHRGEVPPDVFARAKTEELANLRRRAEAAKTDMDRAIAFEDFSRGGYSRWFVTGDAFGAAPLIAPHVVLKSGVAPVAGPVISRGIAHSGVLSNELQGVLRSETFTIEKNHVLYHMSGTGTQVNLIIDGYQLIRNPIYGGLTISLNKAERPQWYVQNVGKWVGHKAYIEFIDAGSGWIGVDKILFSDQGPPAPAPNALLIAALENASSLENLAHNYRTLFAEPLRELFSDTPRELPGGPVCETSFSVDEGEILDWLVEHDLGGTLRHAATLRPPGPPDETARGISRKQLEKLAKLGDEQKNLEAGIRYSKKVMALADGTPEDERVHLRGSHKKLGEVVPRRLPEALFGTAQPALAQGSGRLAFAQQIVDPSNPLLPRVIVNRVWKHHFGEGIARSPDDFGNMGQPPSHPELLDYLAAEFMREGWSIKKLHKLLLLSQTYQMSSRPDDARAEELDPQNRLWHRMPIRRLEGEIIRDAILAVSGRLNDKMSGPGVLPYLTPFMIGRGRPASGPLDGEGRRSIYIAVRRNFLTPMFLAFDYPIPFSTMGRRSVSNVPAQALTLMNNPFVVQQAEFWAQRVLAAQADPNARVRAMYVDAFGRLPDSSELEAAARFLSEQDREYGKSNDLRAWTDLAHVLLNVKEFIFIN